MVVTVVCLVKVGIEGCEAAHDDADSNCESDGGHEQVL